MTTHDDVLKHALRLLTYHRRRIGWITSRVFVLTVVLTALGLAISPKYVARATLTLLPTRSELGFASMRPEIWGLSPAAFLGQTHQEAMLSRTLAEDVARTLQAEHAADLNNGGAMGYVRRWLVAPVVGSFHRAVTLLNTGRWKAPDPFMALVDSIRSRTRVQNLPGSFVFQVSVKWENPVVAARIANLMTERYVQMTLRSNQEEMRATREYLDAQIRDVEDALAVLQQKVKDYRATEQVYSMAYNTSADVDLALQELSQSLRALAAVRADRQQLEARLDALKAYQTPATLAALEAERSGLKARQEAVEKIIDDQMAKLHGLPAKEAGLLDLYRERTIKERALTALQDRLLETKVAEAAQISAVRVIDRALPPLYPERPLLLRNALAAIPVGLLLSLGFVLIAEARRAGLRSREDLGAAGDALLGIVPFLAVVGHNDPDAEKGGTLRDLFRSLVHGRYATVAHRRMVKRHLEHLLLRLADEDSTCITLFTSLQGGEGKTFLIEQMARLAQEAGRTVLLIDANLVQPTLHLAFGKPPTAGLAEVLLGKATAREVVVSMNSQVDLLCAGTARIHGQARWELPACQEQLRSLAAGYDLVLMDSAALSQDPAVSRLLTLCDRAVCVFDATSSARDDLAAVREHLRGASTDVHFVLNKVLYKADYLFGPGRPTDRGPEAGKLASATLASR